MANNDFTVSVTGTSYNNRQGKLWNLRKNAANAYVTFTREPKNEADPNAIKVIAHIKGQRPFDIGYLKKEVAAELAPVIDAGYARPWIHGFETKVTTYKGKKFVNCMVNLKLIPMQRAMAVEYETE